MVFENALQFLLTLLLANHKKNAQKQEIGALKTENFFCINVLLLHYSMKLPTLKKSKLASSFMRIVFPKNPTVFRKLF